MDIALKIYTLIVFVVEMPFLCYNHRMKWLIFTSEKDNAGKIVEFLEKNNAETEICSCDFSESISKDKLSSISDSIKGAEYFVILDFDKVESDFLYFYGLMSATGRFVLCQGKNVDSLASYNAGRENFHFVDKRSDALKIVKDNFKELYSDFVRSSSFNQLLSKGLPFNAETMVHAIEKDKMEIVELAYNAGLDVNSFTEDGVPVLCAAARCDSLDYVKWLLKHNADVNIISKDRGYSPVMDAVWKKNLDMVKLLIKSGANLDVMSSDGQPILVLAVGNGSAKIVDALMKAGANADIKDGMGMSARSYANLFKKTEIVKILEKYPKKED